MKFLVLLALVAVCSAKPQNYFYSSPLSWTGYPYAYSALTALPYTATGAVPIPVAPAAVVPAIAASKYHAQDVLGQASFGHVEPFQSRAEVRDVVGNVRGSYSYVDPNGKVNVVEYTAGHGGFRVLGANNLPEAPAVPETPELKAPEPVQDTPEVVAARAEFARQFAEAATAAAEDKVPEVTVSRRRRGVLLPIAAPALVPAVAKTTLKVSSYEPVDAAVPASTRKLELTEKEHDIYTPVAYSAIYPAPALKLVADEKTPVDVKTVAATPLIYGYSGFHYGYPYAL